MCRIVSDSAPATDSLLLPVASATATRSPPRPAARARRGHRDRESDAASLARRLRRRPRSRPSRAPAPAVRGWDRSTSANCSRRCPSAAHGVPPRRGNPRRPGAAVRDRRARVRGCAAARRASCGRDRRREARQGGRADRTARRAFRCCRPTVRAEARSRARGRAPPTRAGKDFRYRRAGRRSRRATRGSPRCQSSRMAILGVDVGGTFTDAVLVDDGLVRTAKVVTSPRQEESVVAAARAVGADRVDRFAHGTTVATNALLERKGARTAFVTTMGFEHLLHLRRQTRADLYRLCAPQPEPLVALDRCFGVRERMGPDGVLQELDLDSLSGFDAEAVAVCLLHAYRHPQHERTVAEELRRRLPTAHVVASHEVAPEFREYERASTTVADAFLGPVAGRYLRAVSAACASAGLPEPLVMRSSGGVTTPEEAAEHPATILVSGPAAGAVGAARVATAAGFEDAIGLDMGGTSTDVCLISGGRADRTSERPVGR